jgi:hypothetical protein
MYPEALDRQQEKREKRSGETRKLLGVFLEDVLTTSGW